MTYSVKHATVSTKPRFFDELLTLFWHFNKGAEQQSGRSLDTLIDMWRDEVASMCGSFVKVSKKCQKFVKNLGLVETVKRFAL